MTIITTGCRNVTYLSPGLAIVTKDLGQIAQARQCAQRALEIFEAIGFPQADQVRRWLSELEEQ